MPVTTELAIGTISFDFGDATTYFGFFTGLSVRDSEGLQVYYAPDSTTTRKRFGAVGLQGAGILKVKGVLASTAPSSDDFCSGIDDLVDAALSGSVDDEVTFSMDFDFDGAETVIRTLYDVKVGDVSMQTSQNLMVGTVTFQFSRGASS